MKERENVWKETLVSMRAYAKVQDEKKRHSKLEAEKYSESCFSRNNF